LWDINTANVEFITKFVNFLIFDEYISLVNVYKQFREWNEIQFKNDGYEYKGYVTNIKSYYIARGYDEKDAENIISQR